MTERLSFLKELLKSKLARLGSLVILLAILISVLGAYIRPDNSKNANSQNLAIARMKPGFTAQVFEMNTGEDATNGIGQGFFFGGLNSDIQEIVFDSLAYMPESLILFWNKRPIQEFVYSSDLGLNSSNVSKDEIIKEIEAHHLTSKTYYLGTDSFGRDMLSRLMAGTIVSLSVGFISVLISLVIGIGLGALAGYYRGWVDNLIMWFINVIWSIPTLLMVIAITLVMGKGFVQVFIAVGLTMWVEVARIVRGQFLSLRTLPYVEAGRTMGFSSFRLVFKHMLPNAIGPVIVISAANFASAILIEAGLSFLGIGTQIPTPSWGTMIKEHYAYITTDMAYLAILPGLAITVLVLAFMLLGNSLRDSLDVRD